MRHILLVAAGVVVALVLGESVVRVAVIVLKREPTVVGDPKAGWRNRPDLHDVTVAANGGRFTMSTDGRGRRIVDPPGHTPSDPAPVVLLVGDSFVLGMAVDDAETFGALLGRRFPHYRFVNLGVPGYGTDQELVQVEEFFAAEPAATVSHIVLFVYENDFQDVQEALKSYLGRTKPRFHVDGDRLVRGAYQPSWRDTAMDYSRLAWLVSSKWAVIASPELPPGRLGIDLVIACVTAMRNLAAEHHAAFHLLMHRYLGHPSRNYIDAEGWDRFRQRSDGVDITDLIRADDAIGYDGEHWSTSANRRVADIVSPLLGAGNP